MSGQYERSADAAARRFFWRAAHSWRLLPVLSSVMALATAAHAQITPYNDETAFLRALAEQGYATVSESFEDDAAWGDVRSTISGGFFAAPSVTSRGITWHSSSARCGVTTGHGAARAGDWGFYSYPHGDFENGIGDGFGGTGDRPLVAVGGWIRSNTPPAKVGLFLNGDEALAVDFGAGGAVGVGGSQFFGVIRPEGFTQFDYRELEGVLEDQKLVFADDFTFVFSGEVADCNENGVADPLDIAAGTSADCNENLVPDECEIAASSTAPGGPFFCSANCDPDCNGNGVLDACEVVSETVIDSGELSPIGSGSPQSFTITAPPTAMADVILRFTAYANLGGNSDFVTVSVGGKPVGVVFGTDGSDCPEGAADTAILVVPRDVFNDAASVGDVTIDLVASAEVAPDECDLPSFISVRVSLFVASELDADADGVPDECQDVTFLRGECNGDGDVDISDAICILNWLFRDFATPGCVAGTNANGDGDVDLSDAVYLLLYLSGRSAPPAPFPTCGAGTLGIDVELGCQVPPTGCSVADATD